MQTRFLLGPAGSGKTFRCLAEIRAALKASPEGAPLILLAPKQATFQLERQLLGGGSLAGYARLQIFSFDRLADFVLTRSQKSRGKLLSEEGRVMVLRALLSQHKEKLKIFRSSARTPGFAQQLSLLLRELQRHQLAPDALFKISAKIKTATRLEAKLHDFALLLEAYFDWLEKHQLQDANRLLDLAADVLRNENGRQNSAPSLRVAGLWMDGFAEMTPQEIDLLAALVPSCDSATLAFCLDPYSGLENKTALLSIWSVVNKTYQNCRARLEALPGCKIEVETLPFADSKNRFGESPALRHLADHWARPKLFEDSGSPEIETSLRAAICPDAESEAILAAHEILRFVRRGGRFRQVAVLLRQFEGYHAALRRIFSRYEIPFFLDRRESAAHHPLAELTRSALRLPAFGWEHEDWFGILKSGLAGGSTESIDQLENEALARGWKKEMWLRPLKSAAAENSVLHFEKLRQRLVPPFQRFCETIGAQKFSLNGKELADATDALWQSLEVQQQLETWAESDPIHATAWDQMQAWLKNVAQAFPDEKIRLNDWLPILESGLSGMTVGAIPPVLDQVLIGTIDRSRNPDLRLALVLGLNESIFPAPPKSGNLLTESDLKELATLNILSGPSQLDLLGREQFYGYIACTRARERLVLTCAAQDGTGRVLNPSQFFSRIGRLFPALKFEKFSTTANWIESQHRCELVAPLIQANLHGNKDSSPAKLAALPVFDSLREQISRFSLLSGEEKLSAEIVTKLYGDTLKSSVSALEQYAACPFRFFISVGLRAEERKLFELDTREQGSFQHAVLAEFHAELRKENKRWRDISASEARERIRRIASRLKTSFREGLLGSDAQTDFAARSMTESLQDFIETIIHWMGQYEFDPLVVELAFGTKEHTLPAWEIDLGEGRRLAFRGVIDRVDICPLSGTNEALAVVIDYKSSAKQIDPVLFANGLQLQLPAYLAFLRRLPDPAGIFGVARLVPAGVFYVNLRGRVSGGKTRDDVLGGADETRRKAYQHSGRFDLAALRHLDNRGQHKGSQFNYRLKQDGEPYAGSREIMRSEDFLRLLEDVERHLVRIGREIFSGEVKIDPYQKGNARACDQCDYQDICRIDSWTHPYRVLKESISPTHSLAR